MSDLNIPVFRHFQDDEKKEIKEIKEIKENKEIKDTGRVLKDRYKICPNCSNFTNYSDPNRYCYVCGSFLIDGCPECKEPIIYPNSKFCPVCGTILKLKINS